MPIFKKVNKDFFKKWTGDMAYVLGFLTADGTLIENNRGAYFIEFDITDKDLLIDIREALSSNHKISARKRKLKNHKISYRLQIGSKEIFFDLQKFGLTPRKSKIISFPNVPENFLSHYIRGYFDGDGGVYFKKHKFKDRKNLKWVFTTRFTSGSHKYLSKLIKKISTFTSGGFIVSKKGGYDLVFSRRDSLALYAFMYNNCNNGIFLNRKYRIFKKAVKTLYGV